MLYVQITRIIGAEANSPYDILGANKNMSAENMKKRYTCAIILGMTQNSYASSEGFPLK